LEGNVKDCETRCLGYREQLRREELAVKDAERRVLVVEAELSSLRQHIKDKQGHEKEERCSVVQIELEVLRLKAKLDEANAGRLGDEETIQRLRGEVANSEARYQTDVSRLEHELAVSSSRVSQLVNKVDDLRVTAKMAEADETAARQRCEQLLEQIDQLTSHALSRDTRDTDEMDALRTQLRETMGHKADAERSARREAAAADALRHALDNIRGKQRTMTARLTTLESDRSRYLEEIERLETEAREARLEARARVPREWAEEWQRKAADATTKQLEAEARMKEGAASSGEWFQLCSVQLQLETERAMRDMMWTRARTAEKETQQLMTDAQDDLTKVMDGAEAAEILAQSRIDALNETLESERGAAGSCRSELHILRSRVLDLETQLHTIQEKTQRRLHLSEHRESTLQGRINVLLDAKAALELENQRLSSPRVEKKRALPWQLESELLSLMREELAEERRLGAAALTSLERSVATLMEDFQRVTRIRPLSHAPPGSLSLPSALKQAVNEAKPLPLPVTDMIVWKPPWFQLAEEVSASNATMTMSLDPTPSNIPEWVDEMRQLAARQQRETGADLSATQRAARLNKPTSG